MPDSYLVHKLSKEWKDKESFYRRCAKVILTTDTDLIEDRVERIDNEFLKWFVNNPTCEFVEVFPLRIKNQKTGESGHYRYEFNIPQEEETKEKEHPFFNLKLNKEEAEHLLRCLVQTNAKGKDLDIGEEVEGKICDYLKNNK